MSQAENEPPIFTKASDFLAWLVPATNHFPKSHRATVTARLLQAALEFVERLVEANHCRGSARLEQLHAADVRLDWVRFYLRLAYRWQWMTQGQYEHVSRMVAELGRLLGGWRRVTLERRQSATEATAGAPAREDR